MFFNIFKFGSINYFMEESIQNSLNFVCLGWNCIMFFIFILVLFLYFLRENYWLFLQWVLLFRCLILAFLYDISWCFEI